MSLPNTTQVSKEEFFRQVLQRQKEYCTYCVANGYNLDLRLCEYFLEDIFRLRENETDWYLYPDGTYGFPHLKYIFTNPYTQYLCIVGTPPITLNQCVIRFKTYVEGELQRPVPVGKQVTRLAVNISIPLVYTPDWRSVACWIGLDRVDR